MEYQPARLIGLWGVRPIRWTCYLMLFYSVVAFGVFGNIEFIYFQF
jgi:hypothetical protein